MGIVTTTSGAKIEALLGRHLGRDWRNSFATVIGAEEAPVKKPDPQAYHRALAALGVTGAEAQQGVRERWGPPSRPVPPLQPLQPPGMRNPSAVFY